MADYFTYFSVIVELPTKEAQEYALNMTLRASEIHEGDAPSKDLPAEILDVVEDWSFETVEDHSPDKWGVWLHSSNGGVDAVCVFIQHLLQKFDPHGHVAFEWSNDCSKPRLDAYGGGAVIITAQRIKSMSTFGWLHKQTSKAQQHHGSQTNDCEFVAANQ